MENGYIAHSELIDKERKKNVPVQFYENHINGVFLICKRHLDRIKKFCPSHIFLAIERTVLLAAEYHDLGKLDNQAQDVLWGKTKNKLINHVDAGVAYLLSLYDQTKDLEYLISSYLIHAHHIGFVDFSKIIKRERKILTIAYKPTDNFRDKKSCVKYNMDDIEVCEHTNKNLSEYLKRHKEHVSLKHPPKINNKTAQIMLSNFWVMKVALSILCDADHEDTSLNYDEPYPSRQLPLNATNKLKILNSKMRKLRSESKSKRNKMRSKFFDICNTSSKAHVSLMDGVVGIGKTISMAAHFLKTALRYKLDTIFIVLPYISLIEQSASVYKNFLLENTDCDMDINTVHSIVDPKSLFHRKYIRGFNAPINLTTSVNMFETIMSNRTGLIKHIHKFIGSVICIDEYGEVAPKKYWPSIIKTLNEFAMLFSCKVILSSGTSPNYWKHPCLIDADEAGVFNNANSIIPKRFYKNMIKEEQNRVKVEYLSDSLNFAQLWKMMEKYKKSLFVIFNTRSKAFCFTEYIERKTSRTIYLRFSALAAVDREVQYREIKKDLKNKVPIIVVGTQGCDVGLDLDFHDGFKERSNYNSILQMRGRINRNCRFKTSKQIIFQLVDCPLGDNEKLYNNPSVALETEALEDEFENFSGFSPELCPEITSLEIDKMTDKSIAEMTELMTNINSLNFETVSKNFKLIKMPMIKLMVNPDTYRKMIRGEYVSYAEVQNNIVNVPVSKSNMSFINQLAVPMIKNKKDRTDRKYYLIDTYIEDIEDENDENEDYYDMYFWTGEYDKEKYGIYKGIKSRKVVNIPTLIV